MDTEGRIATKRKWDNGIFVFWTGIPFLMRSNMGNFKTDLAAVMARDPAAHSKLMVILTYSGYKAIRRHRRAHWFYNRKMRFVAELISARTKRLTGIDIHPGAKVGKGVFIDHGVGVVIGETCEIGNDVTIYQGVTLGGTGKDTGKRHPTIADGVMISAGAKVLGPIHIGEHSKVGAGSVVLKEVPPNSTVVGVPGRIVKMHDVKITDDLDQMKLPDPVLQEFARLCKRIGELEKVVGIHSCKYSIVDNEVIEDDCSIFDKKVN